MFLESQPLCKCLDVVPVPVEGEETRTNGHINKDMGTNCDEFLEEKNACC